MILPRQNLSKTFRPLISTQEARKILNELEHWDGSADKQWKARAENNQAAIDRGDPLEYARVFKSLSKLEVEGDLRPRDRAHLNQSLEFLTEELSKSLGKTPQQARNLISKVGGFRRP